VTPLRFYKLQGAGNDFVLLDAQAQLFSGWEFAALARRLCDRRFGVGADGLLIVEPSERADYRMRLYNADGSEATMCGNGIRCVARYLWEYHCPDAGSLAIETGAGIRRVHRLSERQFRVEMGTPELREVLNLPSSPLYQSHDQGSLISARVESPHSLPSPPLSRGERVGARGDSSPVHSRTLAAQLILQRGERAWECGDSPQPPTSAVLIEKDALFVHTGAPHLVLFVDSVDAFPLETLGPQLERHPQFPDRVNVSVAQVEAPNRVRARVWERGAGATLACGTGACAIVVAGVQMGRLERTARVQMPGGTLTVEWRPDGTLWLTGDAELVFEGVWHTTL
jgi:diaminopimelate epimerase